MVFTTSSGDASPVTRKVVHAVPAITSTVAIEYGMDNETLSVRKRGLATITA
jgi:hypothetical protein